MITTSNDIFTLDFAVLVDISTPTPTVKFSNLSTGPNLSGCKWLFNLYTPNNTPVHTSTFTTPDVNGIWTNYTLPENLPQPGGNIIWSGSYYRFVVEVMDSTGKKFLLEKKVDICRPNGNENGSNYGKAVIDIQAKCSEAKLYAEDKTNYSYKKQIQPSLILQKKFTLVYPPTEQGTYPTPFIINDFTNGLIPISYSGPGYQAIIESIVQYDLGENITLQLKYKVKEAFPVQCNIDLCQLICEYNDMVKKASDGCDKEMADKLLLINAKINQALIGKMQPLCKIDVSKLVDEIKDLGGFTCNCNCGTGIVALLNPSGGGNGIPDCNAVIACIKALFDQLDPKCLATVQEWQSMTLLGQMQLIINAASSDECSECTAPTDLTFDVITKKLRWRSTNNSNVWRVEYKKDTDTNYTLHSSPLPVYIGSSFWEVDLSGVSYQINAEYLFRVSAQCPNGTYSLPATSSEYIAESCTNINDFIGNVS